MALFGLGGSGLATARALKAGGAELYCYDDNPQSVAKAAAEGLNTADLRTVDFLKIDELLLSPGVPLTHPKPHWTVELAKASGVPVIGDVELFAREWKAKAPDSIFIAITGTNGKSTTTALIAHILRQAGLDVQLGGNIGTAVLSLDEPNASKAYVVECSSYQIDLAPSLAPSIGILLNLTPDHLDRHGDMTNYSQIKARLVQSSQVAIVGCDDRFCTAIADSIDGVNGDHKKGDLIRIASEQSIHNGIEFRDGKLLEVSNGKTSALFDMMESQTLRGAHNAQNAAAAYAACKQAGLSGEQIADGLRSFAGLAHRMEQIGFVKRTLFVNDSKATNADAAARALSSFENIYWIVGGLSKEGGIEPLRPYFSKIKKAYLIGEAASAFSATLGNDVTFEISGTLAAATENANRDAVMDQENAPVILLSPACASFDQFPNFEVRGANFKTFVEALPGFVSLSDAFSNSQSNFNGETTK